MSEDTRTRAEKWLRELLATAEECERRAERGIEAEGVEYWRGVQEMHRYLLSFLQPPPRQVSPHTPGFRVPDRPGPYQFDDPIPPPQCGCRGDAPCEDHSLEPI